MENGDPSYPLRHWHAYVEACGGELFLQARLPAATQDEPSPAQHIFDLAVGGGHLPEIGCP